MSHQDKTNLDVPATREPDGPPGYTTITPEAAIESFPDPISSPNEFSACLNLLNNLDLLDVWQHYLAIPSHTGNNQYVEISVAAWVDRMDGSGEAVQSAIYDG